MFNMATHAPTLEMIPFVQTLTAFGIVILDFVPKEFRNLIRSKRQFLQGPIKETQRASQHFSCPAWYLIHSSWMHGQFRRQKGETFFCSTGIFSRFVFSFLVVQNYRRNFSRTDMKARDLPGTPSHVGATSRNETSSCCPFLRLRESACEICLLSCSQLGLASRVGRVRDS